MARSEETSFIALATGTETGVSEADDSNGGGESSSQNTTPTEKPFKCPECGRGFRLQTQLNSHNEIVHLKRRPFACKACNIDFSCRGNYTKHCETKNHQKKVQEISESGAPVTPEMLLTGEALKAHLAKLKSDARNGAKPTNKSPSKSPRPVTMYSGNVNSKALEQLASSPISANKRGVSGTSSTISHTLLQSTGLSGYPSPASQQQNANTNGGSFTVLSPPRKQHSPITKVMHNHNSFDNSTTAPVSRKRTFDDVDEYEKLVSELNACKAMLTEVQKHCKKLQAEKEKLENDHPSMRERIDGLSEQVRFKNCLLKKLEARKAAVHMQSSSTNGNINNAVAPAVIKSTPSSNISGNSMTFSSNNAQSGGAGSDCSPSTVLSSPPSDAATIQNTANFRLVRQEEPQSSRIRTNGVEPASEMSPRDVTAEASSQNDAVQKGTHVPDAPDGYTNADEQETEPTPSELSVVKR